MKKTKQKKRRPKSVNALLALVLVLIVAFCLSAFVSQDMVTNRFRTQSLNVQLIESNYDKLTKKEKSSLIPNSCIDKDPKIRNTDETDAFVFLKVTVPVSEITNFDPKANLNDTIPASYSRVETFEFTNQVQSFTAQYEGYYKLEAWGAQGGNAMHGLNLQKEDGDGVIDGGKGGYSSGTVYLQKNQTIYVCVGGQGQSITPSEMYDEETIPGGYNGGGNAYVIQKYDYCYFGSGGGATHFALSLRGNGVLSDYESKKKDVLLVAGGGGGAYSSGGIQYYSAGGNGGGENGGDAIIYYTRSSALNGQTYNGTTYSYYQGLVIPGGGQTAKQNDGIYVYGTFGQGAIPNGNSPRDYVHSGTDSGAGGGWYGGARLCSYTRSGMAGGGGSGHCSDLYLVSDYGYATIGGDNVFAAPDGTDEYGHSGDGYARVTLVEEADISVYDDPEADIYEFDYTGAVQTFMASADGNYKLEAWGAQGGGTSGYPGGRGAYTSGEIYLCQGETIYIYVGGAGKGKSGQQTTSDNPGGFNGGGIGLLNHSGSNAVRVFGSGGGATDFRLVGGSCTLQFD